MNGKFTLFLSLILFCISSSFAQKVVRGKVTDASDKTGIPGVSIKIKGLNAGTVTDQEGNYSLKLEQANNPRLVFSAIGYTHQEVSVGNRNTINIALAGSTQSLAEVNVVGALGIT
uniref:carboxypeptidase-like regulatory domain-containing protein n=1 Tax=Pedobacter sp. TaxID=1411316 RepID=UPI003D7F7064